MPFDIINLLDKVAPPTAAALLTLLFVLMWLQIRNQGKLFDAHLSKIAASIQVVEGNHKECRAERREAEKDLEEEDGKIHKRIDDAKEDISDNAKDISRIKGRMNGFLSGEHDASA